VPGACALCKSTEICRDDTCVDPCDGVECTENEKCVLGNCKDCTQLGCANGQICFERTCQEDACRTTECADTELCFKGECKPLCDDNSCATGQRCNTSGSCEKDRCAGVSCESGKVCRGGTCSSDPCLELSCDFGQVCVGEMGCIADPCSLTTCPRGATCSVNEAGSPTCVSPTKPAKPPVRYVGGGGSGLTTCSVTQPGGSAPSNAGWLLLPAIVWSVRRRLRKNSQSKRAG